MIHLLLAAYQNLLWQQALYRTLHWGSIVVQQLQSRWKWGGKFLTVVSSSTHIKLLISTDGEMRQKSLLWQSIYPKSGCYKHTLLFGNPEFSFLLWCQRPTASPAAAGRTRGKALCPGWGTGSPTQWTLPAGPAVWPAAPHPGAGCCPPPPASCSCPTHGSGFLPTQSRLSPNTQHLNPQHCPRPSYADVFYSLMEKSALLDILQWQHHHHHLVIGWTGKGSITQGNQHAVHLCWWD